MLLSKPKWSERLISAHRTDTCLTPERFLDIVRAFSDEDKCFSGAQTGPKPVFADVLENRPAAPEEKSSKTQNGGH